jgi:hypothetical protein
MCQQCITFRVIDHTFVEKLGLGIEGRFIISISHAWELLNRYVDMPYGENNGWFERKKEMWENGFIVGDIDLLEEKSLPLEYWQTFERNKLHNYFSIYKLPETFVLPEISDVPE